MLQIKRTWDLELILGVLHDPRVWTTITEDNVTEFIPDVIKEAWLCVFTEKEVVGLYRLHSVSQVAFEVHINILPEFRDEFATESVRLFYRWCLDNVPDCLKLQCTIPKKYRNVYLFAKAAGMTNEGFRRASYLKNGKLLGQNLLGITREEVVTFLEEIE